MLAVLQSSPHCMFAAWLSGCKAGELRRRICKAAIRSSNMEPFAHGFTCKYREGLSPQRPDVAGRCGTGEVTPAPSEDTRGARKKATKKIKKRCNRCGGVKILRVTLDKLKRNYRKISSVSREQSREPSPEWPPPDAVASNNSSAAAATKAAVGDRPRDCNRLSLDLDAFVCDAPTSDCNKEDCALSDSGCRTPTADDYICKCPKKDENSPEPENNVRRRRRQKHRRDKEPQSSGAAQPVLYDVYAVGRS